MGGGGEGFSKNYFTCGFTLIQGAVFLTSLVSMV